MVDRSELKALARRAVENLLKAYREHKLVEYVANARGVRVHQSLIDDEWVIDSVELLVSVGNPSVWVRVEEDKIVGEAYKDSKKAEYEYRTREASDILDIVIDILAHTA